MEIKERGQEKRDENMKLNEESSRKGERQKHKERQGEMTKR